MSRLGIVVIGYDRIDSIQRVMKSLYVAEYGTNVDLIVSIDNSGKDDVVNYANKIEWIHGKKIVRTFPERLGLKKHVLTCGNYINEYQFDALVVLEDDLYISPDFFNFAVQAVERYEDDMQIAGISLYSHSWNIYADRPFIPLYKGYDVFFMQYPQSWGQVWMRKQWNEFYEWYQNKMYEFIDRELIPENVLGWPESSWLKFHVEYCIVKNKYIVYPYQSLSTNYADAGTHYAFSTNKMQVPISIAVNKRYIFPHSFHDSSIYDSYYENSQLAKYTVVDCTLLEVDMYGMKKKYSTNSIYLITTKARNLKLLKSYGLQMRPWELNIICNVPGTDIYLYDMRIKDKAIKQKHNSLIHWVYDTRGEVIMKRNFLDIMINEIINKFRGK